MTPPEWLGLGALAVAPTLAFIAAVYRAGQLARSVEDLAHEVARLRTRVDSMEQAMRGGPRRR